jgi:hypothetical protein
MLVTGLSSHDGIPPKKVYLCLSGAASGGKVHGWSRKGTAVVSSSIDICPGF